MSASSSVKIDYLSFTTRPDFTVSQLFIEHLDKRKKVDLFQITAVEYYKSLTALGQAKVDVHLSRMAQSLIFDGLSEIVCDLEFKSRDYGYCGYTSSAELFRDGTPCGLIAWGGKNAGVFVSLTGAGMAFVDYVEMHEFISSLTLPSITRIDLAYDSFDGSYNFDWCDQQYRFEKGFNAGGNRPSYQIIESGSGCDSDGNRLADKGQTFYVGNRKNGKLFRGYEKGKQMLGQGVAIQKELMNWFRLEVEVHNTKRKIPLEVLLRAAEYMAATYPCLGFISEVKKPIRIKKKVAHSTVQNLVDHARNSYGNLIGFLSDDLGKTDKEIIGWLKSNTHQRTAPAALKSIEEIEAWHIANPPVRRVPRRLRSLAYLNCDVAEPDNYQEFQTLEGK